MEIKTSITGYRKTKRLISLVGNLLRTVFLTITVLTVVMLWLWTSQKQYVIGRGDKLTNFFEKRYVLRLEEAKELVEESRLPVAIKKLEKLLAGLSEVKKQDRLAAVYVDSMELLLDSCRTSGKRKCALSTAKLMVGFDDKRYDFWLEFARELAAADRKGHALDSYIRAFDIYPASEKTLVGYVEFLYENAQYDDIPIAVNRYLNANRLSDLRLYYASAGEKFSLENRIRYPSVIISRNAQTLDFRINSADVAKIRMGLPEPGKFEARFHEISLTTTSGKTYLDLSSAVKQMHNVVAVEEGVYITTGTDPFIVMELPDELRTAHLAEAHVTVVFRPLLPKVVKAIADKVREASKTRG